MSINTEEELRKIKEISEIVGETLKRMQQYARPGITTYELDVYGKEILDSFGAISAPKKVYHFPGHTCISVNHVAAHGIPSKQLVLKEGDLVNIDVSAEKDGYFSDNGGSFVLGEDHRGLTPLVLASQQILHQALSKIKGGVKINAVGDFIEKAAKQRGYTTVKNLVGHGIGRNLHEDPQEIPCFYDKSNNQRFRKGSVVAIETFISTSCRYVNQLSDGWTLLGTNGSYIAQHEHTVLVTDAEPLILTQNNGF